MIYRTEHPKPQFMRENWLNLNGEWDFEMDPGCSGGERRLYADGARFSRKINVPFCMESKLSGIEYKDFMPSVWYRKTVSITREQLNGRVIIHFGAVDYKAVLYVNGKECGTHQGGYVSFQFDISDYVIVGSNSIVLNAVDHTRDSLVPTGKQATTYQSQGCFYTRTTGIWQTVWLEFVPKAYIQKVKYHTDIDNAVVTIASVLVGRGTLTAEVSFNGNVVGSASACSLGGETIISVALSEKHLWQVGEGKLYDVLLTYGSDKVWSYFGLRSIVLDEKQVLINGQSVFQKLVLDQGFYPDGIYTAPSDGELKGDIERAMAMGFNGARLHEKVFEERFLYHCDKLGYLVWAEYPNWGLDHSSSECIYSILPEWLEELERDYNHPSIIGWCPFNETWDVDGRKQQDAAIKLVYCATKAVDSTRPCIDVSGCFHVVTDIYDLHDYEQDPIVFAEHYACLPETQDVSDFVQAFKSRQNYDGKAPFFVSEYGGILWPPIKENGWGYGAAPKTEEEFLERLRGLTHALLDNKGICALCYTQLTDVEQERNGLYTYDRKPKFPPEVIKEIFGRKARITLPE